MEEEKLLWCMRIKSGIRLSIPSEEEYNSYIKIAKEDLINLKEDKIVKRWKPIVAYYSAYYSLYAILRLLGMKSENHSCSIVLLKRILREIGERDEIIDIIEKLKRQREEAQYYLIEEEVNIEELERFVNFMSNLKRKFLLKKNKIRNKIKEIIELSKDYER